MKELLPVHCQLFEDLVESTEGFTASVEAKDHPVGAMDFSDFPPLLGYNLTFPKPESERILNVKETGDPLLVRGTQ